MNVLLWVSQTILGLLCLAGGYFKVSQFETLTRQFPAIPQDGWRAFGMLEMLGAVLLIVPAAIKWMPALTPLAASVLAVEALALSVVYAQYSLKLTAQNPLIFSVIMTVMAGFVAYGRFALEPLG